MNTPIKILIADDHQVIIEGIKSLLVSNEKFQVVAEANDGDQVIEELKKKQVDIAFIDINMPGKNGIEVLKYLNKHMPSLHVILLSMYSDLCFIKEGLRYGISGYILKNTQKDELERAILTVAQNKKYFSRVIEKKMEQMIEEEQAADLFVGKFKLTSRESEILKLILEGKTTKEIATILFITTNTVDTHRKNIVHKMNVKDLREIKQVM